MSDIEVTLAVVLITVLAGVGVGAMTRGWTPRRNRIVRPRLWGCGVLVGDAGFAAFVFFGPFQSPGDSRPAPFALAGGVVAAVGILVQGAATGPAQPTKSAS